MSPIFWVDVVALGIATITASALALIAVGAGLRNTLNASFALFTLLEATWAFLSFFTRMVLWLEKGNPTHLSQTATLIFALMSPLLLLFTAHYVNRYRRRLGLIVALGLAVMGVLAVPLYEDRIVSNPHLGSNGVATLDLSPLGLVVALLPAGYIGWSLILFGQERRRLQEPYLAFSVFVLAVGFFVGGIIRIAFPVLSVTNTLSVSILGYGVISRQLFNPLRAQTLALQREAAERQRAVEALRENEQRLELALKGANYALWDWDIPSGKVTRNERWPAMLGYNPREIEPHVNAWWSRCHPDDLAATKAALDAHFSGQTPFYEAEYRVRTRSGDWLWVYDRGQIVERDEQGAPRRIIGIEQDITARKRVEAALVRSEQERRVILDSMSELVVYQNPRMEIIWANHAAGQSVGMTPEQLVGRRCYEIWHGRNARCEECPVSAVFATGQSQETKATLSDGRHWLIRGYPVKDASGQVEGMVEVAQDITARVQAEQRQRDYIMERERANILHYFISSASHDLKTPLTTIKLSLHLMHSPNSDTRLRHLEILEQQTAHLEQLLENMLNMSRLDSEMKFKFEFLDLNQLIRDIIARYEGMAQRKRQGLTFVDHSALPLVWAAKIHLAQALSHLIVNALQYTPDAGQIVVRTSEQNQHAVIEIQDNGMGISAEDLPHIFEHFYRVDKARSSNEGGTGLGLTMAKRIVDAHQGRIDVESESGSGSCFRVWLPLPRA